MFLVVIGTRPEAIKLAPIIWELKRGKSPHVVVHSGQHTDLVAPIFDELEIQIDFYLHAMVPGQELHHLLATLVRRLGDIIQQVRPTFTIVQGDTTTALAGALSSVYNCVEVAHVEAGLRTHHLWSPFPEEANRKSVGALSSLHFAPTVEAYQNLIREGIPKERITLVGNTVVDTLYKYKQPKIKNTNLILATIHRRENHRFLDEIFSALLYLSNSFQVVLTVHPNPAVKEAIKKLPRASNLQILPAPSYLSWLRLVQTAALVITDSGGVQEECASLGIPLLVARDTTERPEIIQGKHGYLVGHHRETIVSYAEMAMRGKLEFRVGQPFGDGHAAQRIVAKLLQEWRKAGA
ncbi:MAG: UDP-N-acetylglucosamine 2-epimerase (non-hydrolyzing) [Firmicutes bacterium]|nr:UDP-N-acetylglucosamine 2-epimerase (non-hydrolyzing) [Bacillota bacterium]